MLFAYISVKVIGLRRILLMSHGNLAEGMLNTLNIIVGTVQDVDIRCVYVDGNNDVEKIIDNYLAEFGLNELIVITDIFGGSVNNEWLKRIPNFSNIYLISGMNLNLVINIYLGYKNVSSKDFGSFLKEMVESSSKSIIYCDDIDFNLTGDEF